MIPTQSEIETPFLEYMQIKKTADIKELYDYIAKYFELTHNLLEKRYPVSGQKIFENRVRFARANLIQKNLNVKGTRVGEVTLSQYSTLQDTDKKLTSKESPFSIEVLESEYNNFRLNLKRELLELIMKKPPEFLEYLILELMKKIGYGSELNSNESLHRTGKSGDDGIDGYIKQDKLGFENIYMQAKRWTNPIGDSELRNFSGSLDGIKANKGIFITTSSFSKSAIEYTKGLNSKKIILIDGDKLTDLMIDYNLGVSHQVSFELKKIDTDLFNQDIY
jgi:restriction system protein